MKKIAFILMAVMFSMPMMAQKEGQKLYNEEIDPMEQIDQALEEARETDRFVVCQVGGNWCPWCIRFANFINEHDEIAAVVKENFVYIHVNYSKDHRNPEAMLRLGNPGRFGYPAIVILDQKGQVIHIQNSAYLEKDKSYDEKKVLEFFQNWTRKAIEDLK